MIYDLNCPYCDAQLDVCHDDGFGYQEDVNHEMNCYKCGKNFVFQTSISFRYDAEKADCLNDGEHDYKQTVTAPVEFTKMQCSMCGDSRELTEDERQAFGIRTRKEYFDSLATPK